MRRVGWLIALVACGKTEDKRHACDVTELRRWLDGVAALEGSTSNASGEVLAELRTGGARVEPGPIVYVGPIEVIVEGRLVATTASWTADKANILNKSLAFLATTQRSNAPDQPLPVLQIWITQDIAWEVVVDVVHAALAAGFVPGIIFRSPLGIRDVRASWVTPLIDEAARKAHDTIPVMLKHYREDPNHTPAAPIGQLVTRFRQLWATCPLPQSPALHAYDLSQWPAWRSWVTTSIPDAIVKCECKVDLAAAEGFAWAMLGGPRYRLTMLRLDIKPSGQRLALPKGTVFAEAATQLGRLDKERPIELVAE